MKEKKVRKRTISGIPTAPGVVQGKVRIVLDPQKDRFYQNEILVVSMTRPEFVPLMKKAKAVVTNEGGITWSRSSYFERIRYSLRCRHKNRDESFKGWRFSES